MDSPGHRHRHGEHFLRRAGFAILPVLVWIAHFAFCYGLAAYQCTPAGLRAGGPDRALLGGATLAALAACAWMAWRGRGALREGNAGLAERAHAVLALLSLVAVAWAGVPLLLVAGCA